MTYFVAYTWDGHTIFRVENRANNVNRYTSIASFDNAETADAVCRDLNRAKR